MIDSANDAPRQYAGNGATVPHGLQLVQAEAPDPWSPESMILSQDFSSSGGTEDILTTVNVGRFSGQTFVRTHREFRMRHVHVLKLRDDPPSGHKGGETFFVAPPMVKVLSDFITKTELFVLISRQRAIRVWPIAMDLGDGKWNQAHKSATRAIEQAITKWLQIDWIGGDRGYVAREARATYPEPEWYQNVTFPDILRLAFDGAKIQDIGHPIAKELFGPQLMHTLNNLPYREVWSVDFAFIAADGENLIPVCVVSEELRTKRIIRSWQDQLGPAPPYPIGDDSLFVAYMADAEIGCHLALGWAVPRNILDLHAEFCAHTNGLRPPQGKMNSLLAALSYFNLPSIDQDEKDLWITRILQGPPWSEEDKTGILNYCQTDVVELGQLLVAMLPNIEHLVF
jgi:hypothetical protein